MKIGRDDIGPGVYEVSCDECFRSFFTSDPKIIDGYRLCGKCAAVQEYEAYAGMKEHTAGA